MLIEHQPRITSPIWLWKLRVLRFIMFVSSIAFTAAVFLQVVARYLFSYSIFGIEELASFTGIVMYFIGSAYGTHERSHISASLVDTIFGEGRVSAALHAFTTFLAVILTAYVAWSTVELLKFTATMGTKSVELRLPMVWVYGTMLAGLVLMILYFLIELYERVMTALGRDAFAGGEQT